MVNTNAAANSGDGEETVPVPGGKGLEHLQVFGNKVLVIDQFMLANDQFLTQLGEIDPERQSGNELQLLAQKYGGCVLSMPQGVYRVYRDPMENIIVLCPGGEAPPDSGSTNASEKDAVFDFSPLINAKGNLAPIHHVYVDTRCLVFLDASLLFDQELVDQYRGFRNQGKDKEARDLLRSHGGAVRYGFNRYGDELGVFSLPEDNIIALWPDVID
jgi:hypothetical protein